MDASETTVKEITSDDGSITTLTMPKGTTAYISEEPTKKITLSAEDYTITPTYKDATMDNVDSLFIGLNLNLTKENLTTLLKDELNNVDENISYLVDVTVTYKLNKYPEKYKYFYSGNLIRGWLKPYTSSTTETKSLDLSTESVSQVLNVAVLQLNDTDNTKEIEYNTTLSSDNSTALYILNYLALSSKESTENIEKVIMFHTVDNIDYLITNINSIEDSQEEVIDNTLNIATQDVAVPNTAMNKSTYLYFLGEILILIGVGIIFRIIYKKEKLN
jgi:hypothetical protein